MPEILHKSATKFWPNFGPPTGGTVEKRDFFVADLLKISRRPIPDHGADGAARTENSAENLPEYGAP